MPKYCCPVISNASKLLPGTRLHTYVRIPEFNFSIEKGTKDISCTGSLLIGLLYSLLVLLLVEIHARLFCQLWVTKRMLTPISSSSGPSL